MKWLLYLEVDIDPYSVHYHATKFPVVNQVLNYTCPPVPYWEENDQIDPYLSQMMIEPFVVYSSCLTTIMTISESD